MSRGFIFERVYEGILGEPIRHRDCSEPGTFRYISPAKDDVISEILSAAGTSMSDGWRMVQGKDGTIAMVLPPDKPRPIEKPEDYTGSTYVVEVYVESARIDGKLPSELVKLLEDHGFNSLE